MSGLETGALGAIGLLAAAVAALIFGLYFVPVPLWIAAWSSGRMSACSHSSACGSGASPRRRS
jgi:hypothetical protein